MHSSLPPTLDPARTADTDVPRSTRPHTTNAVRRRSRQRTRPAAGLATVAISATVIASLFGSPHTASAAPLPTGAGLVLNAPVVSAATTPGGRGYWEVAADGGVFAFGNARFHGSAAGLSPASPIVGIDSTADGRGYWEIAANGGVFAFGDAGFHGSLSGGALGAPVVGMASTADGRGYWLVASDGGVFAFGDAAYSGSATGMSPASAIVGLAPSSDGRGYWEVTANGGVYAFGDAPFLGTAPVRAPVVGIDAAGGGYRVVSADGGTFAFGGASFHGSLTGLTLNKPIVGTSSSGNGYIHVAADGGIFNFGSVGFYGSLGASTVYTPPPPPPSAIAPPVLDYGLSSYQIAAWDRVNVCEEGGNWYVNGSVFAGGLGMSRANWNQFNSFGFSSNAAYASPLQQIRVAVAFATHYYGNPDAAPDQNGCTGGY